MASGAGRQAATQAVRRVKPIVSRTPEEARSRVINIYRRWVRLAPDFWWNLNVVDVDLVRFRAAIKDEFVKNAHFTDLRIIDRLVHKAEVELENAKMTYTNVEHLKNYLLKENLVERPSDFLSRFFAGKE